MWGKNDDLQLEVDDTDSTTSYGITILIILAIFLGLLLVLLDRVFNFFGRHQKPNEPENVDYESLGSELADV